MTNTIGHVTTFLTIKLCLYCTLQPSCLSSPVLHILTTINLAISSPAQEINPLIPFFHQPLAGLSASNKSPPQLEIDSFNHMIVFSVCIILYLTHTPTLITMCYFSLCENLQKQEL